MKPKNKSEGYPVIFCKECGHECTKTDFKGFSGLCDHLFLDALARSLKNRRPLSLLPMGVILARKNARDVKD